MTGSLLSGVAEAGAHIQSFKQSSEPGLALFLVSVVRLRTAGERALSLSAYLTPTNEVVPNCTHAVGCPGKSAETSCTLLVCAGKGCGAVVRTVVSAGTPEF